MKTRKGFVSNSSTSSFVIEYLTKDVCPYCHSKTNLSLFKPYRTAGKEEILEEINIALEQNITEARRLRELPQDQTVKDNLQETLKVIAETKLEKSEIEKTSGKTERLEIPNHYSEILEEVYQAEVDGKIRIIHRY